MATNPHRIRSADEILGLDVPPGILGYELVDGQLVEVMPVGGEHGEIAVEIAVRLRHHLAQHPNVGRAYMDAGFVLGLVRDPERMRAPDVSFVSTRSLARHGGRTPHGFLRCPPDLAIEIESLQRPKHQKQRIHDYLEAGTTLVWVIHVLARTATAYLSDGSTRLLSESDVLDGEAVIPGLKIPLRELFDRA